MKKGDIVIAPEGKFDYFTALKEYEVTGVFIHTGEVFEKCGHGIFLTDDEGANYPMNQKGSKALGGKDWIIKSEIEKK